MSTGWWYWDEQEKTSFTLVGVNAKKTSQVGAIYRSHLSLTCKCFAEGCVERQAKHEIMKYKHIMRGVAWLPWKEDSIKHLPSLIVVNNAVISFYFYLGTCYSSSTFWGWFYSHVAWWKIFPATCWQLSHIDLSCNYWDMLFPMQC